MPGRGSRRPEWLIVAKGLAILVQLGIQIVIPIVAGVVAGAYLERKTGSVLWFLAVTLVGIFAGLWNGYRMLLGFFAGPQDQ